MLSYLILDHKTGSRQIIAPICYEDCMNPGKALAIPVQKTISKDTLHLRIGETSVSIPLSDLDNGLVEIREEEFTPSLPRQIPKSCSPCTNCGKCSW